MSPFQSSARRWKTTAAAAVILMLAPIKLSEKSGQILPPTNAFYEIAKFSSHRNVQTIVLSEGCKKECIFNKQIWSFCGFQKCVCDTLCVCVHHSRDISSSLLCIMPYTIQTINFLVGPMDLVRPVGLLGPWVTWAL